MGFVCVCFLCVFEVFCLFGLLFVLKREKEMAWSWVGQEVGIWEQLGKLFRMYYMDFFNKKNES